MWYGEHLFCFCATFPNGKQVQVEELWGEEPSYHEAKYEQYMPVEPLPEVRVASETDPPAFTPVKAQSDSETKCRVAIACHEDSLINDEVIITVTESGTNHCVTNLIRALRKGRIICSISVSYGKDSNNNRYCSSSASPICHVTRCGTLM